jgi:MOSC domain-containing protein YiiM
MQLLSINLGSEKPIPGPLVPGKTSGTTGIFKTPVDSPVRITEQGLQGDTIVDAKNHGGVDQAVYLYTRPDYDWWAEKLGETLAPGTFGENLTLSALESAQVCVGDRFTIGKVVLEATAPRIPCRVLAARMDEPTFVKRFRLAERPGIYCRVIQSGEIQAGQPVVYTPGEGDRISILEMFRDSYEPFLSEAKLRRYLTAPIAIRDRNEKEEQLRVLLANQT